METVLDILAIMQRLPHRYPFLLIDRIVRFVPGQEIVALKNVTMNEPFFQGHFPAKPVMPGVLIIEALAQAGGILAAEIRGAGETGRDHLLHGDGRRSLPQAGRSRGPAHAGGPGAQDALPGRQNGRPGAGGRAAGRRSRAHGLLRGQRLIQTI